MSELMQEVLKSFVRGMRRGLRKARVAHYYRRGRRGQQVYVGAYETRRASRRKPKAGDLVQVYIQNTYRGPVFMRVKGVDRIASGTTWYSGTTYKTLGDLLADRNGEREQISDMISTFRVIRKPEREARVEIPPGLWRRPRKAVKKTDIQTEGSSK